MNYIGKFFLSHVFAAVAFCVVSYLSVVQSLVLSSKLGMPPTVNIGWPFRYYYQLWVERGDLQHGGMSDALFYDYILCWAVVLIVMFVVAKRKKKVKL